MITAALDCSQGCSLAIRRNQTLLCSEILPGSARESDRILSPWLDACFRNLKIEVTDVKRWSAGTGPGSFAGLRCGIALLKGICRGGHAKMRGVPSCYALARSIVTPQPGQTVGVLHDGRCGQVILTRFLVAENLDAVWQTDPCPLFPEELLEDSHLCDRWITLSSLQLPQLPPEVQKNLQQENYMKAEYLLDAEEQWPWPDSPLEQENSCQPLYVRQAVFVKPSPIRT